MAEFNTRMLALKNLRLREKSENLQARCPDRRTSSQQIAELLQIAASIGQQFYHCPTCEAGIMTPMDLPNNNLLQHENVGLKKMRPTQLLSG